MHKAFELGRDNHRTSNVCVRRTAWSKYRIWICIEVTQRQLILVQVHVDCKFQAPDMYDSLRVDPVTAMSTAATASRSPPEGRRPLRSTVNEPSAVSLIDKLIHQHAKTSKYRYRNEGYRITLPSMS